MKSKSEKFFFSDPKIFGLILLGTLIYTLPATPALEYLRHTEADRSLIAWEMVQSGNYLVPHLFGDLYLTKPPLFYWILASVFSLVGAPYEWAARSVSGAAAALLLACYYLFLRHSGWQRPLALLAVVVLGSAAQFFMYSVKAEIDMFYAMLCGLSLFLSYLSFIKSKQLLLTLLSYLFLSLAFLCKGPPIGVFFGSGVFLFAGYQLLKLSKAEGLKYLTRLIINHSLGSLLFAGVIFLWLSALASQTSWSDLYYQFNEEILNRFVGDKSDPTIYYRPFYFYLLSIPTGFLPWTFLALGYFIPLSNKRKLVTLSSNYSSSLVYALCVIVPSLIIFSISSGKSSRYLFPIYPFVAQLLIIGAVYIKATSFEKLLKVLLGLLSVLAILASFLAPYYLSTKIDLVSLVISSATLLLSSSLLLYYLINKKTSVINYLTSFVLFLILLRVPFALIYAPLENQRKSVHEMIKSIEENIAPSKTMYVLEIFERWIPYYLIRDNIKVLRLTPRLVNSFKNNDSRVYVLLNKKEESWRINQIKRHDKTVHIKKAYSSYKDDHLLVEIAAASAHYFKPKKVFPTYPSEPY